MDSVIKQFSLKKPCSNCPFRNDDKAIELQDGRIDGIVKELMTGAASTFHCHKTVYGDERNFDDDGNYAPVNVKHCAGAAAVARKMGTDTQCVQIATRLGIIKRDHYERATGMDWEKAWCLA